VELANALLENNGVTYMQLVAENHTKRSAEAMAKYVCTGKCLQRIRCDVDWDEDDDNCEEMFCTFLPAFQESTSLKELQIDLLLIGGPSKLAFENMLTHTQSLRSLTLICPVGVAGKDIALAAARSGLKKNTTLRELTLDVSRGATILSPIFTSLHDHPLIQRLCLRGYVTDLDGLETLLLSDNSEITELDIQGSYGARRTMGLTHVLQALARRPTLAKLGLRNCLLSSDEARLLRVTLCNIPSLQSLGLTNGTLERAELAELAPALYRNTSIQLLDISMNGLIEMNGLIGMASAGILRDILRSNKTITTLDLSYNRFGQTTGAVECIADGLCSNSTLLNVDLSSCALRDGGVAILAQHLGRRNTTLQKLSLKNNSITSTGFGVLVETMEHSCNITDLDLGHNPIGNEGASLLARSLGNNALPNLTRLSLSDCGIGDDGLIALTSALEQNKSLLHLDFSFSLGFSERACLALAESLPEIKVLQRIDLCWYIGLASVMPLLLVGLRKNTSLFSFHVADCAPSSVPPTTYETAKYAGDWLQEMERLGCRNRFLSILRTPEEAHRPRGVWPRALARVATFPDVIFELIRSKPSLVRSEENVEATEATEIP
jgi:Ran GTPase-activating protein (RanGAP) involved in mRNA processing and transport